MPPPYGVVPTGWESKPLDVIDTEMKEALRAAISPTLNLGSRSLLGQLVSVVASQLRQLWEAGQANYAARDREQASGDALDSIGELTGSPRDAATRSRAMMTITLAAGTYPAHALKVHVTNNAVAVFDNALEITTAGATLTDQLFEAVDTGPVSAPAGTLVNITTPYTGFSAPTNPADATLGENREEDPAYRQRQEDELQKGSSTVDAIRSALLENDNITSATVLENETDLTDANGLPPHSVCAIVLGGTDAEVAQIIFEKKAGGPRAHGSTVVTVYDEQGNPHPIGLERPVAVPIAFSGSFDYDEDAWESPAAAEAAVTEALLAEFTSAQRPSLDVIYARYVRAVMGVEGAIDIALGLAKQLDPPGIVNIVIDPFEYATLDAGDISINAIAQPSAP